MSMAMTPARLTKHKRDPAWKHCQMFEIDDKLQLKCNYCDKLFKGGGIHRMKEHLAGHRTNASTCPCTPPEVRHLMQHSLDAEATRKKHRTPKTETNERDNSLILDDERNFANGCDLNNTIEAIPILQVPGLPELNDSAGILVQHQEEIPSRKTGVKKKRGRPPKERVMPGAAIPVLRNFDENDGEAGLRKVNSQIHLAIGRFLYDLGVPLHAVNSVHFQQMVDAIAAQGSGVLAPTYNDLRGWILKNAVDEVRTDNDIYMSTWGRTGCSILVDQWQTTEGSTFVDFLVSCPERTMFLKSVDVTDILKSVDALSEILKEVINEVGAGHVVQVITNGDMQFVAAGKQLMEAYPTLLSNACASRSIHLILEDFGKLEWIHAVLERAKSVTRFVYNHSAVLNTVRRHTFGHDLVVPGHSCSETNFATLKRLVDLKGNLQSMVRSPEWMMSSHSKRPGGLEMIDVIGSQTFWCTCTLVTQLTDPLLRLLRIVSSEKRTPMAYIYGGMYRIKEAIKKQFVKREDHVVYWSIIDRWWQNQWTNPLHAAGFYLNPKFFYSMEGDLPNNVVSGMLDCVEKLVSDITIQDKIIKELAYYKNAAGDFGRKMAIRARDTLLPVEWWSTYGGACPNLSRLAVRILSQSCGIIATQKNQGLFDQLINTKNCIEHRRLSDLLFIQYNLRLAQNAGQNKYCDTSDPISVDNQSVVQGWISQTEQSIEDYESANWVAIEPPPVSTKPLAPPTDADDVEHIGKDFKDNEIFSLLDYDHHGNISDIQGMNYVHGNIQENQEGIEVGSIATATATA